MTKQLYLIALSGLVASSAVGCGDDNGRPPADAGNGIHLDAGPDGAASPDAGRVDSGARPDAGDGTCRVGTGCTPDRGCLMGECMAENTYSLGGPGDPITGYMPTGGDMDTPIPGVFWAGGYCTPVPINFVDDPSGCDPNVTDSCGDPACAQCMGVGQQDGRDLAFCAATCTPSLTENTCPRPTGITFGGQTCLLGQNVCFPGCASDDECRVQRRDTNMNGMIDAYDPMMNPMGDHLVYDDSDNAMCNMVTFRCEHDGTAGAEAGIVCEADSACEQNGDCITASGWTDSDGGVGYCSKFGCDTPGNGCAGAGVCQERRLGISLCLHGCTVAAEAGDPDWATGPDVMGPGGHARGCRGEYSCIWNGVDAAGVPNNGACVPGEYNAVTTPNIGAACTDGADCYSPFGGGVCYTGDFWLASGYCSIMDCGAPGMPTDVCGTDAQCVQVGAMADPFSICFAECMSAADCSPGYSCVDVDNMAATPNVCWPACQADADCRTGETCTIPPGEMAGTCG